MIVKRGFAFLIDYLIIAIYAVGLFFASPFLIALLPVDLSPTTPITNQIVGFITLTLPVFLYFYISERRKNRGTFGKRILGLRVEQSKDNRSRKILARNLIKFLPWEVAHCGVHFLFYYDHQQLSVPIWNWALLIIPQVVVIFYIYTIIVSKGESSFYDRLANTEITYDSI